MSDSIKSSYRFPNNYELAKDPAVEFANWLAESEWKKVNKWDGVRYWHNETYPRQSKSTEELYEIFKASRI